MGKYNIITGIYTIIVVLFETTVTTAPDFCVGSSPQYALMVKVASQYTRQEVMVDNTKSANNLAREPVDDLCLHSILRITLVLVDRYP